MTEANRTTDRQLNPGQSETIRVLREEIVKRDSKIASLQQALYHAWDDLNELRVDAQEAEKRAFDAIEALK